MAQTPLSILAGAGIADRRWSIDRKQAMLDSRVMAGKAIMAAIEQADTKPRTLIQASAVGYYGIQNGDSEVTEEASPGNDYLAQVMLRLGSIHTTRRWYGYPAPHSAHGHCPE